MGGIRIKNDLFDIVERLKAIDSDYYIVYNVDAGNFELHCERCRSTLQLVLPYSALDKRTVDYVLKTRVEKIIDEIKAIDEFNAAVEDKRIAEAIDKSAYLTKNLTDFINNGGNVPSLEML